MRWPWTSARESAEAEEHVKEIADVTERLDAVADRLDDTADRFDDQLAVLKRNGDQT